jgi:hypothetical protein
LLSDGRRQIEWNDVMSQFMTGSSCRKLLDLDALKEFISILGKSGLASRGIVVRAERMGNAQRSQDRKRKSERRRKNINKQ